MKVRKLKIYLMGLTVLLSALAGQISLAATELAKINDSVITLEEFNKKYKETAQFFALNPPSKKTILDEMIRRELGLQEAKKLGIDKEPEIQERINTVIYQALLEKKLTKEIEAIHISTEEAKKHYKKNPEIRTSHIFVPVRLGATENEQKEALEKIKKIRAEQLSSKTMSFAEVAQRFSEDASAPMGGDLDYRTREQLDPAYYTAALKLESPGQISDIVRSQLGYHIIKLTGIHSWEEADHAYAKRMVFEEQRGKVFEKYTKSLRDQAKVKVNNELLE